MGLILDSSIVIAAERSRESALQLLERIVITAGDQRVALSAIGLTELAHAMHRAPNPQLRQKHELFLTDLLTDMEVVPYATSTTLLAGKIDAQQRAQGVVIPFADLLIGVTALEHGYSVATVNLRHFRLIPGLKLITL
jgi:predicted nucleic acid-binding protein